MSDVFTLPMDWDEWRAQWNEWKKRAPVSEVPKAIPGKNFLADEVLGTFALPNGRTVELSELTFPSFERDPKTGRLLDDYVRGIGLTFVDDRSGNVVHSWQELNEALELRSDTNQPKRKAVQS